MLFKSRLTTKRQRRFPGTHSGISTFRLNGVDFAQHSSPVWICHRLKGMHYIQYIHYGGGSGLFLFPDSGNKTLPARAVLGLVDTWHSKEGPDALLKVIAEHQLPLTLQGSQQGSETGRDHSSIQTSPSFSGINWPSGSYLSIHSNRLKYNIHLTVNPAVTYVISFLLQHTVIVILIIRKSDVQLIVGLKKSRDYFTEISEHERDLRLLCLSFKNGRQQLQ